MNLDASTLGIIAIAAIVVALISLLVNFSLTIKLGRQRRELELLSRSGMARPIAPAETRMPVTAPRPHATPAVPYTLVGEAASGEVSVSGVVLSARVQELVRQRKKIEAIKELRLDSGLGLAESKRIIDRYASEI